MKPAIASLSLVVSISVILASAAVAGDPIELAVTEIKARRGIDPILARVVEDHLINELSKSEEFLVIGRDDIARMLDHEQQKQLSGCDVDSCLAEIGGAMGVDRLVAGSMDQVGESILISLKILDTRTGKVLVRESERLRSASEEDALDAIVLLSRRLLYERAKKELPVLAVTEIQARRGVDPVLAKVVEEYIAGEIAKSELYSVIGRDDIARLMDHEQQKMLLGCDAESCLAEIGGALGAEKLLAGSMDLVGTSVLIALKVIDVKRAKVDHRESERLRGATEEDALDGVSKLFRRLFGKQLAAARQAKDDMTSRASYRRAGAVGEEPSPAEELPPSEPEPESIAEAPPPPGESPKEPEPGGAVRLWTWIAAGAAVAALGAGTGLEVVASRDQNDLDDLIDESKQPGNDITYDEIRDLEDEKDRKAIAGHVMLGIGGALAVTAVVLFFVEGAEKSAEETEEKPIEGWEALMPLLGPRFAGLALGGRF